MGPGDRLAVLALAHEFAQEDGRRHHAAVAFADVGEVRDLRVEAGAQLFGQRHRPEKLAGAVGGGLERAGDGVGAHHTGGAAAEGDQLRAGEGGDVDDGVRELLAGGDDAVRHDQPALGIGVEDLDGLAAEHGEHVGRALGGAGGHVLGDAEPGGRLDGQAEAGDGQHAVKDDGGARHVGLHVAHAEGRLDRDAAGVERDALAHEGDLGGGPGGGVFDLDQARLPGGTLADAEDAAEAFLFQTLLVPYGDLDRQSLGQFLGGVREGFGVEVARRLVDQ